MSPQCKHQSYWYSKTSVWSGNRLALVLRVLFSSSLRYKYVPFEQRLFGKHWSERTHRCAKSWTQVAKFIAKHGEPPLPELAPLLQGGPRWERDEPFRSRRRKNFVSMWWRQANRIIQQIAPCLHASTASCHCRFSSRALSPSSTSDSSVSVWLCVLNNMSPIVNMYLHPDGPIFRPLLERSGFGWIQTACGLRYGELCRMETCTCSRLL